MQKNNAQDLVDSLLGTLSTGEPASPAQNFTQSVMRELRLLVADKAQNSLAEISSGVWFGARLAIFSAVLAAAFVLKSPADTDEMIGGMYLVDPIGIELSQPVDI